MATAARVLVVEDDRKTADLVALYLRHAGLDVVVEHSGDRGLARFAAERFELLVLDLMVPAIDGLEICRRVRATSDAAIIMLTAKSLEEDRLRGFGLGADDYVTKPFSPRELVARVQAVLRRTPGGDEPPLRSGPIALDRARHVARVHDRLVELTASEFALLAALMERPGQVRSRAQLVERIASDNDAPLDRTVDVHIKNIRRKLDAVDGEGRQIETVIGVGYRMAAAASGKGD